MVLVPGMVPVLLILVSEDETVSDNQVAGSNHLWPVRGDSHSLCLIIVVKVVVVGKVS
jgi:hypothetical protein